MPPPSTPQLRFKGWIGHHLYINKHAHIPNHRQITKNDCRYTTPWITVCRVLKQTLFYKVVPIHPQKQSALASIHNVILKLTCTPIPCFRPRTHTDLDKARLLRCRRRVNRNNGGSRISNHSPLKNKKKKLSEERSKWIFWDEKQLYLESSWANWVIFPSQL